MKIRSLITILCIAFSGQLIGQPNDSLNVVINHIFFCIDSATYENLFKHDFIRNIFANTSETSVKTLNDSWTGKYLMGRQSYIEVFASNSYKGKNPQLGDKFGDLGIAFKTMKPGDINKIDTLIKADKKNTRLKLNEYESDGNIIPFTYNLYLVNDELEETFRPYADEKTTECLKFAGFNESEINSGITEEQFREKIRGKKYEKLFDNIEKIELILTNKEFEYLAETLKYFGFSQTHHQFTNDQIEISCSIQDDRKYKLKAIYFTLLSSTDNSISIEVSSHLLFRANGKKASFEFKY